jgi:uncharacterized protein YkwD
MLWLWAVSQILSMVLGVLTISQHEPLVSEFPEVKIESTELVCLEQSQVPVLKLNNDPTPTPTPTLNPTPSITLKQTTIDSEISPLPTKEVPETAIAPTEVAWPTLTPTDKPTNESLNETVNAYRHNRGLAALNATEALCRVAANRLEAIKVNFSHDGWEEAFQGLNFSGVAENIWEGSSGKTETVVASWDESPGHQKNLQGEWLYGCGVVDGGKAVFEFLR